MAARDVVVSCAITGSADTVGRSPHVPVTPVQIAASAIEAAAAGAAVVHIHVRDPATGAPSMELPLYAEVVERIRAANTGVLINLTTGAGGRFSPRPDDPLQGDAASTLTTPARRIEHVRTLLPEICSLDIATMNFGEFAFLNLPRDLREMAAGIRQAGVLPELEVFDLGHIRLARQLLDEGALPPKPYFQLCLGVPWGAPATVPVMEMMRDMLPEDAVWSAFGVGAAQFPIVEAAVRLGGQVRVGLEDNLYLSRGVLSPGNGPLVARAVEIIEAAGARAASPGRAREILLR
jgi:uncharacterized protein (DUF849 family)